MALVVYNTLTRRKEPFEPVAPGKVGMYVCGPTVYKPSHIGHAVGPIIFDAIKRYLVHRGFQVTWVVNITDVDDKLIVEAAKQQTTTVELAGRVTKDYLEAMKKLHVDTIDIMPRASEHIGDIIGFIERLIERGAAYPSNGDVYFDVTQFPGYGKLSNRRVEEQAGRRELTAGEKRNPADFALWKAAKPDEPDEVKFDSPWGQGRPGWHIECSAMAMRYLGETFDIHGGGMDLVFPHHENEVAQSEAATGKPFVRIWMHNGLTRMNTKKISKSEADPQMQAALAKMTLTHLLRAYPGELIRFFVLSTHYRRPIEYSEEELDSKRKGLETFYRLFERVERICGLSPYDAASDLPEPQPESETQTGPRASARANLRSPVIPADHKFASDALAAVTYECIDAFHQAMDEDFNTAGAIAALFDGAGGINRFIEQDKLASAEPRTSAGPNGQISKKQRDVLLATATLIALGRLIGLFLDPPAKKTETGDGLTDSVMQILIKVRQHLRKKKDFQSADLIRALLAEADITLEDRPDGTVWRAG